MGPKITAATVPTSVELNVSKKRERKDRTTENLTVNVMALAISFSVLIFLSLL